MKQDQDMRIIYKVNKELTKIDSLLAQMENCKPDMILQYWDAVMDSIDKIEDLERKK